MFNMENILINGIIHIHYFSTDMFSVFRLTLEYK